MDVITPNEIPSVVQKIASSGLSVDSYFQKHAVPFSRPQYFRYKAISAYPLHSSNQLDLKTSC